MSLEQLKGRKKKIRFKKGINLIHFPIWPSVDFREDLVRFYKKYELPKNCEWGFRWSERRGKHPFSDCEIYVSR